MISLNIQILCSNCSHFSLNDLQFSENSDSCLHRLSCEMASLTCAISNEVKIIKDNYF